MDLLSRNDDDVFVVNGEHVLVKDMRRRLLERHLPPPHVQQDDEDDVAMFSDDSSVSDGDEKPEPQTMNAKDALMGMIQKIQPTFSSQDDSSTRNQSKGKGKERENAATDPETQGQTQGEPAGSDFFRLIIANLGVFGGDFLPYAVMQERGTETKNMWSDVADHESEDDDFEPRFRRMYPPHSIVTPRVRKPQPEFVTGPSRITLDDL